MFCDVLPKSNQSYMCMYTRPCMHHAYMHTHTCKLGHSLSVIQIHTYTYTHTYTHTHAHTHTCTHAHTRTHITQHVRAHALTYPYMLTDLFPIAAVLEVISMKMNQIQTLIDLCLIKDSNVRGRKEGGIKDEGGRGKKRGRGTGEGRRISTVCPA